MALNRFGLGASKAGAASIKDVKAALKAEMVVPDLLTHLPSSPQLLDALYAYQAARKDNRSAPEASRDMSMTDMAPKAAGASNMAPVKPKKAAKSAPEGPENPRRQIFIDEVAARYDGTLRAPIIGFNERLVVFWANHFAVAANRSLPVGVLAGAYEREAIRPRIFGNFADLLVAAESHPAMLIYLDNQQSIGPNSRANRKGARGLNENLAREILELHTLGVNGGYAQSDVTSFAKVITGWGVDRKSGQFGFNANQHEPGPQTVMGKTYDQPGQAQGTAVLRDLAGHPATAKHIAYKLARHFVADTPPPSLVSKLEKSFAESGGNLTAVYAALIDAPESWAPQPTKIRSPQEHMIAMLRASDTNMRPAAIVASLKAMGQPLWEPPGPNGFADTADVWASPEGLSTRLEVANSLSINVAERLDARELSQSLFGAALSESTRTAIARAESRTQGLAILFMSPEFMRR
ncbi:DUF1800 domain-containing protein [Asticcacaulis machinosus]|uniref:DUF1800 family protein n=1 Tax=Asticcacaulis machinosus TaxID=2984211 RepID=A0ABT5HES6_9CAUL|nr:DUF1800 family protein [Asticcacaulis machinosus]MDC7674576.1 DUF1800 family protein [Asticcacaulis machinosus]